MASKRVELAKQQQKLQGTVQINTSVDDAQKSIEELINAGVRTHEQNRNHFLQRKAKLPSSFYQPRTIGNSCKSRGSSVGHSREGSSDDGIGCSSGRHTLSPSSINNFSGIQNFGGNHSMVGIVHQRQASAPALINCNIMDQQQYHQPQQQLTSRYDCSITRARAIPGSSAGLPPVAHAYSRSLNTVTMHSQMTPNSGLGAMGGTGSSNGVENIYNSGSGIGTHLSNQLPPIAHQRSVKSCDFDAISAAMDGATPSFDALMHHQAPHHHASQQQIHHPHQQPYHPHHQHTMMGMNVVSTAGDLATTGGDFYTDFSNKLNSTNGGYWTDPRAKSQSLDPMTLTAATSPIATGASQPSEASPSAMTTSSSAVSVPSSSSVPQQQQFILQQQNLGMASSCSGSNMDEVLGPLPDGWAMAFDNNGDTYFIDHFNKITTWYDPRLSKEAQEDRIKMRHSFAQQNNGNNNDELKQSPAIAQHQQIGSTSGGTSSSTSLRQQLLPPQHQVYDNSQVPQTAAAYHQHSGGSPGAAMERIQQLKMERNYMLERRQQLCREGLLDRAGTSQQSPITSSVNGGELQQSNYFVQQAQSEQQHLSPEHAAAFSANSSSNISDSSVMEVDFQQPQTIHSGLHQIDPTFVQDLSAGDLNPHEFDKYLQITDTNRQFGVMR